MRSATAEGLKPGHHVRLTLDPAQNFTLVALCNGRLYAGPEPTPTNASNTSPPVVAPKRLATMLSRTQRFCGEIGAKS